MIENLEELITIFNDDNNQELSMFGVIDINLLSSDVKDELLYYLYPMIERLIRCILDQSGTFDIENRDNYVYKTLFSIIESNTEQIKALFGGEEGEEIVYYLSVTYSEDGPRNKIMHYEQDVEIDASSVHSAIYIFEKLVEYYVHHYCIKSLGLD